MFYGLHKGLYMYGCTQYKLYIIPIDDAAQPLIHVPGMRFSLASNRLILRLISSQYSAKHLSVGHCATSRCQSLGEGPKVKSTICQLG